MKKTYLKSCAKYGVVFFGLIAVFTIAMTLAFCIPEEWIAYRVEYSQDVFALEGSAAGQWMFGTWAGIFDTGDDIMMIGHAIQQDKSMNPLEAAMSINGYPRYWHGYMVWLRPMLILFNSLQIRYIYMTAFFMLLSAMFISMTRRIKGGAGAPAAMALSAAVVAGYITVIPTCMQYAHVYFIMLIACNLLLWYYEKLKKHLNILFMVVGMITSFVDFLTAPMLTLGIPLLMFLFIDNHNGTDGFSWSNKFKIMFFCAMFWAIGYVGCWIAKWILGAAVLDLDMLHDATGRISEWTSERGASSRIDAIKVNIDFYFLAQGKRIYIVYLVPVITLIWKIIRHRNPNWYRGIIYLPVCLLPYMWYLVAGGHSFIHPWMAHRIQTIAVFGACLFFIDMALWNEKREVAKTDSL